MTTTDFWLDDPYFDEPEKHIQFVGGSMEILVQVVTGSGKGTETVRMFRLDSPEMTKQRAKDALVDSDLDHMPGPWRDAFEFLATANIRMKPSA